LEAELDSLEGAYDDTGKDVYEDRIIEIDNALTILRQYR
jgi:hypothetical protein